MKSAAECDSSWKKNGKFSMKNTLKKWRKRLSNKQSVCSELVQGQTRNGWSSS